MEYADPFILKADEYKREIDPVANAVHQYASYLADKRGVPYDECRAFVVSTFKKGGVFEFKDKGMTLLRRNEHGDREVETTTVRKFIKEVIDRELIIAPTWTTYLPTKTKVSFLADDITDGIAGRNAAKKKMYQAESANNKTEYKWYKEEQTYKKKGNNAVSGAQASTSTVIFNKTGHSTLTSICRNTSGFGNASNERIVTDNRHYRNPEITLNNIVSITCNTNYKRLRGVMEKFDIAYPSTDDVMVCVRYSTQLYWRDETAMAKIRAYVETLTPLKKAAFVYTGSLHRLRELNEPLVRTIFTELIQKVTGVEVANAMTVIKSAPETYLHLGHQICTEETMGLGMEHHLIEGTTAINTLAATILHVAFVVDKYAELFKCLLVTSNVPPSVAYFPYSIRRAALHSDTDSTLATLESWVIWYCGDIDFTPVGIAVQAAITFFISSGIRHILAVMSANIGVDKRHLFRAAMKSEYRFDVFAMTMLGKHYFALIGCQEGSVYEKRKTEIKGVHLIGNQIAQFAEEMMVDIMNTIIKEKKISAKKYIRMVAEMEQKVMKSVIGGDKEYLKSASINDAESYTKDEDESPYQLHTFWQETFGRKYGLMPNPPYRTVRINLKLKGPKSIAEWLANMKDQTMAGFIRHQFTLKGKKMFTTFTMPEEMFDQLGLIEEIKDYVDAKKITVSLCTSLYLVLETLNLFFVGDKKVNRLVSEVYAEELGFN